MLKNLSCDSLFWEVGVKVELQTSESHLWLYDVEL